MKAEARLARRLGMAEAGGGTPQGAEAAAERLVAQGATALVSFGLAGGLDPGLIAGAIVIPAEVMEHGQRYRTTYALCARFGGQMPVRALATNSILATPEMKVKAHYDTYSVIVDMESGAVARVATRHGLPFAAVRAVCDPAGFALPPLALEALDAGGRIGPWRVMRSVLRRPGQIPALITLSGHASEARGALARLTSKSRGS